MFSAMKPIIDRVIVMCKKILLEPELNLDTASPFFLHSIYSIALANSTQQRISSENKQILEKALAKLGSRWKAAGAVI
jgi:hypothetical protein